MNFNYVVQRQEKAKVCFGSGSERKLLDFDKNGLVSIHARSNMREINDVGPGSYDISTQTSALSSLLNKPTSKLGTVLGGRRAERKEVFVCDESIPGPKYNVPTMVPKKVKQLRVPFNSGSQRMNYKIPNGPGVGTYKITPSTYRRVVFSHLLGKSCLLPAIKMKFEPFNSIRCEQSKQFLEGDYGYINSVAATNKLYEKKTKATLQSLFLCQTSYNWENKKKTKFFNQTDAENQKSTKHSKVHYSDKCKTKLFLVSSQEIKKVKEKCVQLY